MLAEEDRYTSARTYLESITNMPSVEQESLEQQRQRAALLQQWLQTDASANLRLAEQAVVAELLQSAVGQYGVQLGCWFEQLPWCAVRKWRCVDVVASSDSSSARQRQQAQFTGHWLDAVAVCSSLESLPLGTEKVSAILLAHSIERSSKPFLLLQEAARTLEAGGALLLLASSPAPFWKRLGWPVRRSSRGSGLEWRRQLISQRRAQRWLHELGLSIEQVMAVDRPAAEAGSLGSSYVILARKHVPPLTPQLRFRVRKPSMQPAAVAVGRVSALRKNPR